MMPKPKLSVTATDTQVVSPCIYIICEICDFVNIFYKTAASISRHRLFCYFLLFQKCEEQFDEVEDLCEDCYNPILLSGIFVRIFIGLFGFDILINETDIFVVD